MEWTQQIWNRLKSRVAAWREVLASDFDYGKDYFFGVNLVMALAGVQFNTGNGRLRRLWIVYRVAIQLPIIVIFWNLVKSLLHKEKLAIMLSVLEAAIGGCMCIAGMFILFRNYDRLMEVRQYINQRQFGRNHDATFLARSKSFYMIRRIMLVFGMCNIGAILSLWIVDQSNAHFFRLPFDVREKYPMLQSLAETLLYGLFTGVTAMLMLLFMTIYILLSGLRTELQVIAELFGLIFDKANTRAQLKVETEAGNSEQLHLVTKKYFMKYAHEEFRECIQLHQEFLAKLKAIKPLLNATFLIVYYTATVSSACGVFYLLYVRVFTIYALQIFYGAAMIFSGCLICTNLVTNLTEVNESIGDQVYDLDWPMMLEFIPQLTSEYRSMLATILTVMVVSQQPLRLNCFGFFEFTRDQFTELVDITYSLFGFFKNFV